MRKCKSSHFHKIKTGVLRVLYQSGSVWTVGKVSLFCRPVKVPVVFGEVELKQM